MTTRGKRHRAAGDGPLQNLICCDCQDGYATFPKRVPASLMPLSGPGDFCCHRCRQIRFAAAVCRQLDYLQAITEESNAKAVGVPAMTHEEAALTFLTVVSEERELYLVNI